MVIINLSRNWGHQAAITAGLSVAKGDAIVLMDGDLQDPPVVICHMIDEWRRGAQVVVAQRRSRREHGLRRMLFPLFYRVLGFLSDFPIPLDAGIFGLLDRSGTDVHQRHDRPGRKTRWSFCNEPKHAYSAQYDVDVVWKFPR